MQSKNKKQSRIHRLFGIKVKSKLAAAYMDTAVKILIYVVCGALFLGGIYGVVQKIVLPKTESSVNSMFAYESAENGNGGAGGSGGVEAPDVIEENDVISGEHITYRFSNTNSGDASGYVELDKIGNYTFYWANEDGILTDWTELSQISNGDTLIIDSSTLIPNEATKLVVYENSEQYAEVEIPNYKMLSLGESDFTFATGADFHEGVTAANHEQYQASFLTSLQSMKSNVDFCVMNGDTFQEDASTHKTSYIEKTNNYELPNMYYVNGNHDYRTSLTGINSLNNRSETDSTYFSVEHKGVKFIFAGPDEYREGKHYIYNNPWMSDDMLSWLENEINSTPSETPIYLFTHVPFVRLNCDNGFYAEQYPFTNEDAIYEIITNRINLVVFSAHSHQSVYYNGTYKAQNTIIDNDNFIDGIAVGSVKDAHEFSKFDVYDNGNKIIRTTYLLSTDNTVKKIANGYCIDYVNNENYVNDFSLVKVLGSDDISYNKNISTEAPYSTNNDSFATYESFDIPVQYGYVYKFDFTSTSSNIQIGYQAITEEGMNLINSNSNINFANHTDGYENWQSSGFTYIVPKEINNSDLKYIRILFKTNDGSKIEEGSITDVTISRKSNSDLDNTLLPAQYQQVEYIQSSGTQWIDTGFTPNQDTRVICDFQLTSITSSFILGARTSSTSNSYTFNMDSTGFVSAYRNSGNLPVAQSDTERHVVEKNRGVTYFDGETKLMVSKDGNNFAADGPLNLFACNNGGAKGYLPSCSRIYSCIIYDNGKLVREYIPCYRKSDDVVGLYDVLNDKFYTNQGTGKFTAGAPVE